MTSSGRHALVFGATGLLGWGVVNELLESGTFSRVTAIMNRPLSVEDACWPSSSLGKLSIASGVDLRDGTAATLAAKLEKCVEAIATVTDVYYFGGCGYHVFLHHPEFMICSIHGLLTRYGQSSLPLLRTLKENAG
jgi:NAD(P)-dependent dehydrogenase (short-subunit alcohol dehydrogenase family)